MATITAQPARPATGLARYFPILQWLPAYQRGWLRFDLIAGLTILALLIPEGMAYAELAGLPPQTAFYAAPIGLLLYAIFGTSRQLMVAVSAVIATMSAAAVAPLAAAGFDGIRDLLGSAGPAGRHHLGGRRAVQIGPHRLVLFRIGAGGFHHGPRPDRRHQTGAQVVRAGGRERQLLGTIVRHHHSSAGDASAHADRRRALDRAAVLHGTPLSQNPGGAGGDDRGHRRFRAVWPRGARGARRRRDSRRFRAAQDSRCDAVRFVAVAARRARHRARQFCGSLWPGARFRRQA